MAFNVVEFLAEPDECAFDQRCKFGHHVKGHAIYCHNDDWEDSPRKCHRSWYTGGEVKDEDCPGFQPNPAFSGVFDPTPVEAPICSQCSGTRLVRTERGRTATCAHCVGSGSEPKAIELTRYEQDTLELGLALKLSCHDGQYELYVRVAETKDELTGIEKLLDLNLISMRAVTSTRSGARVYLLKLTGKGDAVCNANWAAAKEDDAP